MKIINCHIFDLADRSMQRGYSLEEVRDCIVKIENNEIEVDVEHEKYPQKRKTTNFNKPELGVGAELSKILSILGFKVTENCSCKQRAKVMNWLGLEWCQNNQKIILGWLEQEAKNRKVPFIQPVVKLLLKKAINNYKKRK
jgi:hypothetical protein